MTDPAVPYETTARVRDTCLCLHTQRAARALGRRFDMALKPLGLTNGQFSLLMSLNRPEAPPMAPVAALLGMDRTTLTAALKPLERRGLLDILPDPKDRRSRRIRLTADGQALLHQAMPIWTREHAALDGGLEDSASLRRALRSLA